VSSSKPTVKSAPATLVAPPKSKHTTAAPQHSHSSASSSQKSTMIFNHKPTTAAGNDQVKELQARVAQLERNQELFAAKLQSVIDALQRELQYGFASTDYIIHKC